MSVVDPYNNLKSGFKRDVSSAGLNAFSAIGFFFLMLFLVMMVWVVFAKNSDSSHAGKIAAVSIVILIVPCLFFRRSANFVLNLWGFLLVLGVGLAILVPLCYIVYVCFTVAFG
jgi:hypothetical protein